MNHNDDNIDNGNDSNTDNHIILIMIMIIMNDIES